MSSDREAYIESLANNLTIHEATSLVARIHEKTSSVSKSKRFGMFPISDWDTYLRTIKLEASFWTASEVEFHKDINNFEDLTEDERRPLIMVFGFFAVGDGSIASMLAYQMILLAETFEEQAFYVVQLNNERVHGETYGKMIYTLIRDPAERDRVFDSISNVQSIRRMNEFIEHAFTYPTSGKRQLYATLAAVEYIMFVPLFCVIFWYRTYKHGKLSQIIFSNEQIAKDEAAHAQNGCENYRKLPKDKRYTDSEIHEYLNKIVQLTCDFADELTASIHLTDLTSSNMRAYTQYVADNLLFRMDHAPAYNVANPLPWMNFTELIPKTNFYEGVVGEYARFNVQKALQGAQSLMGIKHAPTLSSANASDFEM